MNKLFFKKTFIYFGIISFIFLVDRISKLYILSILEDTGFVDININQFINFILVWNSGIGFGLFSCSGAKDALQGKKRSENSDEFLVEKKNPLTKPPDIDELPVPLDQEENEKKI